MNYLSPETPLQDATPHGWQFSTRTLLAIVVGCACLFGWMNALAVWTDESVVDVLAQLLAGLLFWSFFGSIGGLVFGLVSRASLPQCLAVALLPGVPAGMFFSTLLMTGIADPGFCIVGTGIVGLIFFVGLAIWIASGQIIEVSRAKRGVVLLMVLVVVAAIGGNLWQLFAELPPAFEQKITIYLFAYNPPPISIGAPVRRSGFEIGYVADVQPSDQPKVRILKLKLYRYGRIRLGEELAIPEPGRGQPEGINVEIGDPRNYTGEYIQDGAKIHCIFQ